ncbi:MAG: hypothetical protein ACLQVD_11510 [Capsulimonadaceae bacterium]
MEPLPQELPPAPPFPQPSRLLAYSLLVALVAFIVYQAYRPVDTIYRGTVKRYTLDCANVPLTAGSTANPDAPCQYQEVTAALRRRDGGYYFLIVPPNGKPYNIPVETPDATTAGEPDTGAPGEQAFVETWELTRTSVIYRGERVMTKAGPFAQAARTSAITLVMKWLAILCGVAAGVGLAAYLYVLGRWVLFEADI